MQPNTANGVGGEDWNRTTIYLASLHLHFLLGLFSASGHILAPDRNFKIIANRKWQSKNSIACIVRLTRMNHA